MVQQMTNVTMNVLKSDLGKFVSDTVKQEDIVENVDTKINLKENSYVKAVKFIIASLLYKKDYAKLNDSIKPNLKNPDYVKIYDYIENEYKNGKKPIVSKIFDMFDDIENTADLSDIVNYNFVSGEDNEKYYSDCLQVLINTGSANTMDMLLSRLAKCKDENEKREIMLELSKLSKEKNKRGK